VSVRHHREDTVACTEAQIYANGINLLLSLTGDSMRTATVVVQWAHILAGTLWVGGQAFAALVLWPALLRQPADRARDTLGAFGRIGAPVMGAAANLVLLLGIVRGTVLGPIRSLDALRSGYGAAFVAALLLTIAVMTYGGQTRAAMATRVFDERGGWRPGAERWLRGRNAASLALLAAVIACMVVMRFGI
jgi:uncharacterized membrane protein